MTIINLVDKEETKKIHDDSFPFPDLSNPLYILQKTVIEEGEIVAVGLVRLTAEGILITNRNINTITRARCSAQLIDSLKESAKIRGLDECHVFVKNYNTRKFLEHIGFKPVQGGEALVIHF